MDIFRLMNEGAGAEPARKSTPRPLYEAQVASLRDIASRYAAPCPFKHGDLVTPRPGHNLRLAGEPMIVLETVPYDRARTGNSMETRLDVRIALLGVDVDACAVWYESWQLEAYVEQVRTAADAAAEVEKEDGA